jgi:hypothetical protein
MDLAAKLGVKLRIYLNTRDANEATKIVSEYKEDPSILSWYLFDEVFSTEWGKSNYDFIDKTLRGLGTIDPYHLVEMNIDTPSLGYLQYKHLGLPGDIVSLDYYAFPPSGNIAATARYIRIMMEMGRKENKPSWIFLLSGGYSFWASRDLTPAERRSIPRICPSLAAPPAYSTGPTIQRVLPTGTQSNSL